MLSIRRHPHALWAALATTVICATPAFSQSLAIYETQTFPNSIFREVLPAERAAPRYETAVPSDHEVDAPVAAHLRRQIVNYPTREAPGTVVIDTPNTY